LDQGVRVSGSDRQRQLERERAQRRYEKQIAADRQRQTRRKAIIAGSVAAVAAVVGLGPQQPIDRLREYGVSVTRVPAGDWTRVGDPMRDTPAGFSYAESWTASDGKGLLIAILGHGPRGSYVIFVTTSINEYKKAQPEFMRWAESVKVF
jgi:hypothetical protein